VTVNVHQTHNFKDEKVRTVRRRWMCPVLGCKGEMIGKGIGMTTLSTSWQHQCNKCGYEGWEARSYPAIVHL
jgi:hypothetical protein